MKIYEDRHKILMRSDFYEFAEFRISLGERRLWRGEAEVDITPREFDTLAALVRQAGSPVDHDDLIREIWGGASVSRDNLRQQVSALRRKLGHVEGRSYIRTTNHGYQFAAAVVRRQEETPNALAVVETKPNHALATTSVDPVASVLAGSPGPRHFPGSWLLKILGLSVAAAIGALAWRSWPSDARLVASRQLTRDARQKDGPMVTDGRYVFFSERVAGKSVMASVPINGGAVEYLNLPLQSPLPLAFSIQRHSLLISDRATGSLWELDLRSAHLNSMVLPVSMDAAHAAWGSTSGQLAVSDGNSLVIFDPNKIEKTVRISLPGKTEALTWGTTGILRLSILDTKSDSSQWLQVDVARGSAQSLGRLSSNTQESSGSWTSDGKSFVFEAGDRNQTHVWMAGRDSDSNAYQLTTDALIWHYPTSVPGTNTILAIARQAHGRLVKLTGQDRSEDTSTILSGIPAYELDYSRDRQWIAYSLYPNQTIWRSRRDGSERKQVSPTGLTAHQPHWSPDGTRIAFMGKAAGESSRYRVYLVPSGGGALDQPLPNGDDQGVPTWSSDGRSLIYGDIMDSDEFEHASIHRLDLQSQVVASIPAPIGMWSPRMSPDGKYLAAVAHDNKSLFLRDNKQTTWRKCATMEFLAEPIWPIDSEWVQFIGNQHPGDGHSVFRVGVDCKQPRLVVDLSGFQHVGDTWVGIDPAGVPLALEAFPSEIYALDWKAQRRIP